MPENKSSPNEEPTKRCPKCQEEVQANATKCKHCGADLRSWPAKHKITTGCLGFILLLVILGHFFGSDQGQQSSPSGQTTSTQPKNPVVQIFDIPSLLGKTPAQVKAILGPDLQTNVSKVGEKADEYDKKDGDVSDTLYINYDPKLGTVGDVTVIMGDSGKTDKDDLNIVGNLDPNSKDYTVIFSQGTMFDVLLNGSSFQKIYTRHPDWSASDCTDVAYNRIWVGMTYDEAVYERGKPNVINPSDYGDGTQYQYCWTSLTPSCLYDDNSDGVIDSYN